MAHSKRVQDVLDRLNLGTIGFISESSSVNVSQAVPVEDLPDDVEYLKARIVSLEGQVEMLQDQLERSDSFLVLTEEDFAEKKAELRLQLSDMSSTEIVNVFSGSRIMAIRQPVIRHLIVVTLIDYFEDNSLEPLDDWIKLAHNKGEFVNG